MRGEGEMLANQASSVRTGLWAGKEKKDENERLRGG